ncbi:MAG: hypothetical protein NTW08_08790 [Gammaproteobacteria bacterium]|nr:hypothetical protein [Gammaproteobacteria bacterium]
MRQQLESEQAQHRAQVSHLSSQIEDVKAQADRWSTEAQRLQALLHQLEITPNTTPAMIETRRREVQTAREMAGDFEAQALELAEQLRTATAKIVQLNDQIAEQARAIQTLTIERDLARHEKTVLALAVKQVTLERDALHAELSAVHSAFRCEIPAGRNRSVVLGSPGLSSQTQAVIDQTRRDQEKNNQMAEDIVGLRAQLAAAKRELEQKGVETQTLEEKVAAKQTELSQTGEQNLTLQQKIGELEEALRRQQDALEKAVQRADSAQQEAVRGVEIQLASAASQVESSLAQVADLDRQLRQEGQNSSADKKTIARLMQDLQDARQRVADTNDLYQTLNANYTVLAEAHESSLRNNGDLHQLLKERDVELAEKTTQVSRTEDEITQLRARLRENEFSGASITSRVRELEKENEALKLEHQSMLQAIIGRDRGVSPNLGVVGGFVAAMDGLEAERAAHRENVEELRQLRGDVGRMRDEASRIANQYSSREAQLMAKLHEVESSAQGVGQRSQELAERLRRQEAELTALKATVRDAALNTGSLEEKLSVADRKVRSAEQEKSSEEGVNASLRAQIQNLEETVSQLRRDAYRAQQEKRAADDQLDNFTQAVGRSLGVQFTEQAAGPDAYLATVKDKLRSLVEENESLVVQASEVQGSLALAQLYLRSQEVTYARSLHDKDSRIRELEAVLQAQQEHQSRSVVTTEEREREVLRLRDQVAHLEAQVSDQTLRADGLDRRVEEVNALYAAQQRRANEASDSNELLIGQLAELRDKLHHSEDEVLALHSQIAALKLEVSRKDAIVVGIKNALSGEGVVVGELPRNVSALRRELAAARRDAESAHAKLSQVVKSLETKEEDIRGLSEELRASRLKESDLVLEVQQANKRASDLHAKCAQLYATLYGSESHPFSPRRVEWGEEDGLRTVSSGGAIGHVRALQAENERLREQGVVYQRNLGAVATALGLDGSDVSAGVDFGRIIAAIRALGEVNHELRQQVKSLEEHLGFEKERNKSLQQRAEFLDATARNQGQALEKRLEELNAVKDERSAKSVALEAKMTELAQSKQTAKELDMGLLELRREVARLEAQIVDQENTYRELQGQLLTSNNALDLVNIELNLSRLQVTEIGRQRDLAKIRAEFSDQQLASSREQYNTDASRAEDLEIAVQRLKQENEHLTQQERTLQLDLALLYAHFESKETVQQLDIMKLREQLNALRTHLRRVEDENRALYGKRDQQYTEYALMLYQMEELIAAHEKRADQVLQAHLDSFSKVAKEALSSEGGGEHTESDEEDVLQRKIHELDDLLSQLHVRYEALCNLEGPMGMKQTVMEDITADYQVAVETLGERLQRTHDALRTLRQEPTEQVHGLQADIERLRNELSQLRQNADRVGSRFEGVGYRSPVGVRPRVGGARESRGDNMPAFNIDTLMQFLSKYHLCFSDQNLTALANAHSRFLVKLALNGLLTELERKNILNLHESSQWKAVVASLDQDKAEACRVATLQRIKAFNALHALIDNVANNHGAKLILEASLRSGSYHDMVVLVKQGNDKVAGVGAAAESLPKQVVMKTGSKPDDWTEVSLEVYFAEAYKAAVAQLGMGARKEKTIKMSDEDDDDYDTKPRDLAPSPTLRHARATPVSVDDLVDILLNNVVTANPNQELGALLSLNLSEMKEDEWKEVLHRCFDVIEPVTDTRNPFPLHDAVDKLTQDDFEKLRAALRTEMLRKLNLFFADYFLLLPSELVAGVVSPDGELDEELKNNLVQCIAAVERAHLENDVAQWNHLTAYLLNLDPQQEPGVYRELLQEMSQQDLMWRAIDDRMRVIARSPQVSGELNKVLESGDVADLRKFLSEHLQISDDLNEELNEELIGGLIASLPEFVVGRDAQGQITWIPVVDEIRGRFVSAQYALIDLLVQNPDNLKDVLDASDIDELRDALAQFLEGLELEECSAFIADVDALDETLVDKFKLALNGALVQDLLRQVNELLLFLDESIDENNVYRAKLESLKVVLLGRLAQPDKGETPRRSLDALRTDINTFREDISALPPLVDRGTSAEAYPPSADNLLPFIKQYAAFLPTPFKAVIDAKDREELILAVLGCLEAIRKLDPSINTQWLRVLRDLDDASYESLLAEITGLYSAMQKIDEVIKEAVTGEYSPDEYPPELDQLMNSEESVKDYLRPLLDIEEDADTLPDKLLYSNSEGQLGLIELKDYMRARLAEEQGLLAADESGLGASFVSSDASAVGSSRRIRTRGPAPSVDREARQRLEDIHNHLLRLQNTATGTLDAPALVALGQEIDALRQELGRFASYQHSPEHSGVYQQLNHLADLLQQQIMRQYDLKTQIDALQARVSQQPLVPAQSTSESMRMLLEMTRLQGELNVLRHAPLQQMQPNSLQQQVNPSVIEQQLLREMQQLRDQIARGSEARPPVIATAPGQRDAETIARWEQDLKLRFSELQLEFLQGGLHANNFAQELGDLSLNVAQFARDSGRPIDIQNLIEGTRQEAQELSRVQIDFDQTKHDFGSLGAPQQETGLATFGQSLKRMYDSLDRLQLSLIQQAYRGLYQETLQLYQDVNGLQKCRQRLDSLKADILLVQQQDANAPQLTQLVSLMTRLRQQLDRLVCTDVLGALRDQLEQEFTVVQGQIRQLQAAQPPVTPQQAYADLVHTFIALPSLQQQQGLTQLIRDLQQIQGLPQQFLTEIGVLQQLEMFEQAVRQLDQGVRGALPPAPPVQQQQKLQFEQALQALQHQSAALPAIPPSFGPLLTHLQQQIGSLDQQIQAVQVVPAPPPPITASDTLNAFLAQIFAVEPLAPIIAAATPQAMDAAVQACIQQRGAVFATPADQQACVAACAALTAADVLAIRGRATELKRGLDALDTRMVALAGNPAQFGAMQDAIAAPQVAGQRGALNQAFHQFQFDASVQGLPQTEFLYKNDAGQEVKGDLAAYALSKTLEIDKQKCLEAEDVLTKLMEAKFADLTDAQLGVMVNGTLPNAHTPADVLNTLDVHVLNRPSPEAKAVARLTETLTHPTSAAIAQAACNKLKAKAQAFLEAKVHVVGVLTDRTKVNSPIFLRRVQQVLIDRAAERQVYLRKFAALNVGSAQDKGCQTLQAEYDRCEQTLKQLKAAVPADAAAIKNAELKMSVASAALDKKAKAMEALNKKDEAESKVCLDVLKKLGLDETEIRKIPVEGQVTWLRAQVDAQVLAIAREKQTALVTQLSVAKPDASDYVKKQKARLKELHDFRKVTKLFSETKLKRLRGPELAKFFGSFEDAPFKFLNPAFECASKEQAREMESDLLELDKNTKKMKDLLTSRFYELEEMMREIPEQAVLPAGAQGYNTPSTPAWTDANKDLAALKVSITEERKKVLDSIHQLEDVQSYLHGVPGAGNKNQEKGMLGLLEEAYSQDKKLEFDTLAAHMSYEDIPASEADAFRTQQLDLNQHQGKPGGLAIAHRDIKYADVVSGIPEGHFRSYRVADSLDPANVVGRFMQERPGVSNGEKSLPDLTLLKFPQPADFQPPNYATPEAQKAALHEARVRITLAMAQQMVADLNYKPTKDEPIRIVGGTKEETEYLTAAVLAVGQNAGQFKIDPSAVKCSNGVSPKSIGCGAVLNTGLYSDFLKVNVAKDVCNEAKSMLKDKSASKKDKEMMESAKALSKLSISATKATKEEFQKIVQGQKGKPDDAYGGPKV